MNHVDLFYSVLYLQDGIDKYLEKHELDISKKELLYLFTSFYIGIIRTKDYPYSIKSFKKLIDLDLFFMAKKDGTGFYCCISSKGIILFNDLMKFLDSEFEPLHKNMNFDMGFVNKNYLPSLSTKIRLISNTEEVANKPNKK